MDYVEWNNISAGVFIAKTSAVLSIEECPLCKMAFATEPDNFGEVQCLGRHVFAAVDDGENYTLSAVNSLPKRIYTKWKRHEDAFVANLDSDLIGCPRCQSPIDLSAVAAKDSRGAFYACCSRGHEFDSYVRVPHIWLYDSDDDGPFSIEEW
ncbi:MAG TPA: hypothetical protein VIY48_11895 [Candidatus Paceibacterota bacterium]